MLSLSILAPIFFFWPIFFLPLTAISPKKLATLTVCNSCPPSLSQARSMAPKASMLLNPSYLSYQQRLTSGSLCSFRDFVFSLASGTLYSPGLPHCSLAAPHPCLVLLSLARLYMAEHLRAGHLVLSSPQSTLTPSVISSGLVALRAIYLLTTPKFTSPARCFS